MSEGTIENSIKDIIFSINCVASNVRDGAFTPEDNARDLDLCASQIELFGRRFVGIEAKLRAVEEYCDRATNGPSFTANHVRSIVLGVHEQRECNIAGIVAYMSPSVERK